MGEKERMEKKKERGRRERERVCVRVCVRACVGEGWEAFKARVSKVN